MSRRQFGELFAMVVWWCCVIGLAFFLFGFGIEVARALIRLFFGGAV